MVKIGLTGGIGSGKTTVAKMFEDLGVPVYYADDKAKELMQKSPRIKAKIKQMFGSQAYFNNKLNTQYLANIVFSDPNKLSVLEKIVHPVVLEDFLSWAEKQTTDFVIMENAILHKSGMDKYMDYVILVTADDEKRLERVIKRDKTTAESVQRRINNQLNTQIMLKKSNFIIKNNFLINDLKREVEKTFNNLNFKLKKR